MTNEKLKRRQRRTKTKRSFMVRKISKHRGKLYGGMPNCGNKSLFQRPLFIEQIENWNRLLEILDSNDTQEKLLKVEIYREMGNFEEAKKAFTGEFDEEYMDTMDMLDKLIEARDSRVMCINPHED